MTSKCKKELTEEQIQQVRKRYATEECSIKQLVNEYGVSKRYINEILEGVVKWKPTVLQRFNEKWTEDENGCHIWHACTDKDGYGLFKIDDKSSRANRISYQLHNGEIPKGQKVRHTCDEPACVNPDHLTLGTAKQNSDDKRERFRDPWQFGAIEYLEMRSLIELDVTEDSIIERFGIKKDTLRSRLKDMSQTADGPANDKVFYYRDRALHEEAQKNKNNPPIQLIIDKVIDY